MSTPLERCLHTVLLIRKRSFVTGYLPHTDQDRAETLAELGASKPILVKEGDTYLNSLMKLPVP